MKRYTGREIEVTYDPVRCLHAAECVRGLPAGIGTTPRWSRTATPRLPPRSVRSQLRRVTSALARGASARHAAVCVALGRAEPSSERS